MPLINSIPRAFGMAQEEIDEQLRKANAEKLAQTIAPDRFGVQTTAGQSMASLGGSIDSTPTSGYWLRKQSGKGLSLQRLATSYSGSAQKTITKLYQDREYIATTRDLSEADRQAALDKKDLEISRVPKLPPIMQQPSAQELFEQSVVEHEGQKGTISKTSGEFKPFEKDKAAAEEAKEVRALRQKNFAEIEKNNADVMRYKNPDGSDMSAEQRMQMNESQIGYIMKGLPKPPDEAAEAKTLYYKVLEPVSAEMLAIGRRLSKARMLDLMKEYVKLAPGRGIAAEEAESQFFRMWKSSVDGQSMFGSIVPQMDNEIKRLFENADAKSIISNDPFSTPGEALATIQKVIKGDIDAADQATIQQMLAAGATPDQVIEQMKKAGYK